MEKHSFHRKAAFGSSLVGSIAGLTGHEAALAATPDSGDILVERNMPGKPHKGKVFAAIQAHLDDIPHCAAGLCAKLINEGYTGYLIRTSNDEKYGGNSNAKNVLTNEQDNIRMAKAIGFSDVYDFYYRNHRMDGISPIEIRGRFIYLFRSLKVDTVVTLNPWGYGEEDPDHRVTGQAVEGACWMAGLENDFPEHQEAGIIPYGVKERYYMMMIPGQPFNRVVDISSYIEQKLNSLVECKSQGGGSSGSALRKQLAKVGKRLPVLGNDDVTADREYVRLFLLKQFSTFEGIEQYGLKYAERFYYIDQRSQGKSEVEEYIEKNAVSL